jgi:hypothetical protein
MCHGVCFYFEIFFSSGPLLFLVAPGASIIMGAKFLPGPHSKVEAQPENP